MSKDKPVVHYSKLMFCQVGWRARVIPVDHANPLEWQHVVNGVENITSVVLNYDKETGEFETKNSIYRPIKEEVNE